MDCTILLHFLHKTLTATYTEFSRTHAFIISHENFSNTASFCLQQNLDWIADQPRPCFKNKNGNIVDRAHSIPMQDVLNSLSLHQYWMNSFSNVTQNLKVHKRWTEVTEPQYYSSLILVQYATLVDTSSSFIHPLYPKRFLTKSASSKVVFFAHSLPFHIEDSALYCMPSWNAHENNLSGLRENCFS